MKTTKLQRLYELLDLVTLKKCVFPHERFRVRENTIAQKWR
jgi:hypothetical protein